MRVADTLDRCRRELPDHEAVVCGSVRLTYAQLGERVDRLTTAFTNLGLSHGTRVAVLGRNCHRYFESYLAAAAAGTVLVPLNHRLAPRELADILADSEAQAVLVDSSFLQVLGTIRGELPSLKRVVVLGNGGPQDGEEYETLLRETTGPTPRVYRDADDLLYLYYTSGTTARPKGVMLSERNIAFMVETYQDFVRFGQADRYLHVIPLGHRAGLAMLLGSALAGGCILLADFEARRCLELLQDEAVTLSSLVPTMITSVLNVPEVARFNLSAWRLLLYGASPMPPVLIQRILRTFGVGLLQSYSMTEVATLCLLGPEDHMAEGTEIGLRRLRSAGRPVPGVEVRLVGEQDQDVQCGAVGEVIVRGPSVMHGYWRQPEATAQTLRGGWMHTGDMATMDNDGYLYLVDRKKDMIISGGENVYSTEVESVLYRHPAVLEAAVVGVPDLTWGEAVKAFVVLKADQYASGEELRAFCREWIAGYKLPRSVEFLESLPKTATGKISKKDLRAPYWATQAGYGSLTDALLETDPGRGAMPTEKASR